MKINILAFGQLTDVFKKSSWSISDIHSTDELRSNLTMQFPELKTMNYSVAVNKKVIADNTELKDSDTVALLPPFSGG